MKTFKQHCLTEAFTRQHYEAVAKIIRGIREDPSHRFSDNDAVEAVEEIANKLADLFKQDNPRFDKGFFLNKCGV